MPDFVTLTCPSCGGKLEITNDIDRFVCAHCGTEHIVRRSGGVVSLAPVLAGIEKVGSGIDRLAAELALPQLKSEIADLEAQLPQLRALRSAERTKKWQASPVWWSGFLLAAFPCLGTLSVLQSPRPLATGDSLLLIPCILTAGLGVWLMKIGGAPWHKKPQDPPPIQRELERTENTLRQKQAQLNQYQDVLRR